MKVVLDIETIPCEESIRSFLPPITPPTNLKDEEKIREWEESTLPSLQEEQYQATALDGTFGRILCIGLITLSNDLKFREALAIYGRGERKLLLKFWEKIKEYKQPYFITYNGLSFDLPFIWKRSVVHQVQPTMELNLRYYRSDSVYDVMAIWSNWRLKDAVKLDILAKILNVGEKSLNSKQVYTLWKEGKLKEIANYCMQDVYLTYACYCRMNLTVPIPQFKVRVKYMGNG